MLRVIITKIVCLAAALAGGEASAGNYPYHPGSVLSLGGTFDPENLQVSFPTCITYDREYSVHLLNRQTVSGKPTNLSAHNEISVEQIRTREHMYKFLGISTAISAHYKFFSASASLNYESEDIFDSDSFTFGMRGVTNFAEVGLVNPRLTTEAITLKKNLPAFYSRCGREWVTQEVRGVQIAVVYTIKNVSQSQRSRLEASVSGGVNGGPLFGGDLTASLTKIFQSAMLSNYYSMRVYAIGGAGVQAFSETIKTIDDPGEVLKKISEYMHGLNYENSVPLSFSTGVLDQFLAASDGGDLIFDPSNRRLANLFLAYEEYRSRRKNIWKFLNDDSQGYWGAAIDGLAWKRLYDLDGSLKKIEEKAQLCREGAGLVRKVSLNLAAPPQPAAKNAAASFNAADVQDLVRDFSAGLSARLLAKGSIGALIAPRVAPAPPACPTGTPKNDVEKARLLLCECLDDDPYLETRFLIEAVPHVEIVHDKATLAPRSFVYVGVSGSAALNSAVIKDQTGGIVATLNSGYDPDNGPVWYGTVPYLDGSGRPPDIAKLPLIVEMSDKIGRKFTKPIILKD